MFRTANRSISHIRSATHKLTYMTTSILSCIQDIQNLFAGIESSTSAACQQIQNVFEFVEDEISST